MSGVVGCLACDLTHGRVALPGGEIHRTQHWRVEHCVGPLGTGTLLVKPLRHVVSVAELTDAEAMEMGPLLARASRVVNQLVAPEQTYVCLWSHHEKVPGHIHFVVQPVTKDQVAEHERVGPYLQTDMFSTAQMPDDRAVEHFASAARDRFSA